MKYTYEITTMALQKNKWGKNDIIVSKVKKIDENGRYVEFSKIDENLMRELRTAGIVTIRN